MPCASCRNCGEHLCGRAGRFDIAASATASSVACPLVGGAETDGVRCDSCTAGQCSYAVHYTEGSTIRGRIVRDVVRLQHHQISAQSTARSPALALSPAPPTSVGVRVFFGCQTVETGMFQKQQADGILGLQVA